LFANNLTVNSLRLQQQQHRCYNRQRIFGNGNAFAKRHKNGVLTATGTFLVSFAIYKWHQNKRVVYAFQDSYGKVIDGLQFYSMDDVTKHNSKEKRIWISFRNGVYDITDFVEQHPGGDKILMAAGGAVDPFWELYAVHKNPQVLDILEKYRIGNLKEEDSKRVAAQSNDPYSTDPKRHPALQPRSDKPYNAEPPVEILVKNFYTPNELFFVRNHLPVPQVDVDEYELEIEGLGLKKCFTFSLNDLKTKFPKHTVTQAIQCAGNRRSDMNKIEVVKGLNWGPAAISNAKWTGVRLVDVLRHCGLNINNEQIKHVQFEGLDLDPAGMPYGASIPSHLVLDEKSEVILAFEMNGEEIPKDHGFPIRLIAPGIVGARNVKWLSKVILSEEESHSHWQRRDYKGFSPNINWDNVNFDNSPSIQDLPVQSAICDPADGEKVKPDKDGFINVEGYAHSGGGRKIVRVDVSPDNGKSWITAELQQESTPLHKTYGWTLWKAKIPVKNDTKKVELICKAVDSSYNTQPETFAPIWNLRGVLSNAWHRISVQLNK
ncbi:putative sulfite oxidase-like protein, partial [Leptotrombidium deliense]